MSILDSAEVAIDEKEQSRLLITLGTRMDKMNQTFRVIGVIGMLALGAFGTLMVDGMKEIAQTVEQTSRNTEKITDIIRIQQETMTTIVSLSDRVLVLETKGDD